jgi:MFS family permease
MGDDHFTDLPPEPAREGLVAAGETRLRDSTLALSPPTLVRYQVLGVAGTLGVIIYVHRVGFAFALPYISEDLHLTQQQGSWLTAIFLVSYGLFEIPCGLLGDIFGARSLLAILVFGWSLTTGLVALAVGLPVESMLPLLFLLVVRFLFGMFQAGAFPLLARILTDWTPLRLRASAQGLIWTCTRLGGFLSGYLIVGLIGALGSWQAALWSVAGLGFCWAIGFWLWFRNRPEDSPRVNQAERQLIQEGRTPPVGHGSIPWRAMARTKSVLGLCLLYTFGGFAANFYVTLLPSWLRDVHGFSPATTALLGTLPLLVGVAACFLGGVLSDGIIKYTGNRKWGRRFNGTVGTLIGGFAWLALGGAQEAAWIGFLLCLIFFCNDLCMGPVWACCADIGEGYAGTLGGAMNMMGNLAGAVGNLIAGAFFGREMIIRLFGSEITLGGSQLVFSIYACSYWLATLAWQLVDVTKPMIAPHHAAFPELNTSPAGQLAPEPKTSIQREPPS